MNLFLNKLDPEEWKKMSPLAHQISFGRDRDPEMDRIDYVLLVNNDREPCCYATIIELDKESVYMQHGGSFPSVAKGVYTVKGYFMFLNWLKERYETISTRILNTNIAMLKLAFAAGLIVNGMDMSEGYIFLNLIWNKKNGIKVDA